MAKAKKLPSGNWRVQVFAGYKKDDNGLFIINEKTGKRIPSYKSFTAASKVEAEFQAAEFKLQHKTAVSAGLSEYTVKQAMTRYIKSRSNVLSPTTLQGYKKIRDCNLQSISNIKIKNLTQDDIQEAVNIDAKTLSAKTILNAHGFLSSVLNIYKPNMRPRTALPKRKKRYKELPSPQKLFGAVYGTDIELPVLLAMWLSFSMSEIRGIKRSDIKDGVLTLNRAIVDVDNKPIEKEQMKEYERTRKHEIPRYIMNLINKCNGDYIVSLSGQAIYKRWTRLLKKEGIPHITFHDLRHVNASVMHLLDIPDKYAMERGGWKTDKTMKAVYQNVFSEERLEVDKKVNAYFEDLVECSKKEYIT